ncbi:PH domain-containing protein [Actinomadura sp. NBRC 104425]|uniref:PH domain-containing protein n=1 Tax=Actinomadura sp. NBRC 104425 TaxID=3032204 RepID=UPI00331B02B6
MSTEVPPLPLVWRPRTTRIVAYAMAGVIVLGMVVLAIVVAPSFKLVDRVLLVLFGLAVAWILHMLARCRVVADASGLTVVNAFRTRRLAWAEVVDATMNTGDPWPTLDLADGTTLGAMGINATEKARAARDFAQLQALLKTHAEAPDPQ